MLNIKYLLPIPVVLGILVFLLVTIGATDEDEHVDPATWDAKGYASHVGVSLEEAQRRLKLQSLAGDLDAELNEREGQTFAGLWIEHSPRYQIVVQFTKNAQETIALYIHSDELAEVLEVRTADVSLAELREAQSEAMGAIKSQNIPVDSGIDIKAGKVQIYVVERNLLDDAIEKGRIRLPDKADIVTVPALSQPDADIYGGLPLTTCTSGFSVENNNGTKGITTAGHCGNSQSYSGTSLPYEDGADDTSYDIQWHSAPGFTVTNEIRYSSAGATRDITGTVGRNSQSIGGYVCKYGKVTHYTCGYISDKNYRPSSYIDNATATFIRVDDSAGYSPLADRGDSGGPWFLHYNAYGTHSGSVGDDAIYMAVNYVSVGAGADVMTSP